MTDSHDSKKTPNPFMELKDIHSIEQLLASYIVAECIIEIRGERNTSIKKLAKDSVPKLNVPIKRYQELYERFCGLVNYSPTFLFLMSTGLEDMYKYNFSKDPSVVTSANQDTAHLSQAFGSTYSALARVNLEEHTLNVLEKGIESGEKKGRVMQTALPMIACLYHDFGKSTEIRVELVGEGIGKGYRAHAEVSQMYIREVLAIKYHQKFTEHSMEAIEQLAKVVKDHHPSHKSQKSDTMISYVIAADMDARKDEMKKIKQQVERR